MCGTLDVLLDCGTPLAARAVFHELVELHQPLHEIGLPLEGASTFFDESHELAEASGARVRVNASRQRCTKDHGADADSSDAVRPRARPSQEAQNSIDTNSRVCRFHYTEDNLTRSPMHSNVRA